MTIQGIPAEGFKTVGQINATNTLQFYPDQEGLGIAVELISSHTSGGPVVDTNGQFLGFISEFDILRMLEAGKDLSTLQATDIMKHAQIFVADSTPLVEAVRIMEQKHMLVLPVLKNGVVIKSITRHDLLRAWIGLGVGVED
ncbi:MAG: hypothetical protein NPIRA02_27310 [Nitrospirales bacterium]|nr:MAG: hypothetical protein NPIRA02_27310 [Nitrospirales bacterium]